MAPSHINKFKWIGASLFITLILAVDVQWIRQHLAEQKQEAISKNICLASAPKLQIGSIRETFEYANAALAGFEWAIKPQVLMTNNGNIYAPIQNSSNFVESKCEIPGLKGTSFSILFPKFHFFEKIFWTVFFLVLLPVLAGVYLGVWYFKRAVKKKKNEELGEVAADVSHEIRGPVQLLFQLINKDAALSIDEKDMALFQLTKIRSSTEKILNRYRKYITGNDSDHRSENWRLKYSFDLRSIIQLVIKEKKFERPDFKGSIQLTGDTDVAELGSFNLFEWGTVFSNLLDNSIDALAQKSDPRIEITLKKEGNGVICTVLDNGKGIPKECLPKLFQKNQSFGKTNGTGLGLWQVQEVVIREKGSVTIDSKFGKGTSVRITFPVKTISESIRPNEKKDIVLIDDEEINHRLWRIQAKSRGIKLHSFYNVNEFIDSANSMDKTTPIFVDSNFGEGIERGERTSLKIYNLGFRNIYLSTGATDVDDLSNYPWLESSVGKGFPSEFVLLGSQNT